RIVLGKFGIIVEPGGRRSAAGDALGQPVIVLPNHQTRTRICRPHKDVRQAGKSVVVEQGFVNRLGANIHLCTSRSMGLERIFRTSSTWLWHPVLRKMDLSCVLTVLRVTLAFSA